jgi:TIR domain-containing protein
MDNSKRNLIFISHATPEDNTFVIWLSTRLKLLGYEVWSDVTQLFGGEKWWDEIEEAIDVYTAKFVLVITKTSLSKPGVIRELESAFSAEEKHGLDRFIIPTIIDDSSFGGQPYDLSERNIIAFSNGWASGLEKLKKRLNRDNIPFKLEQLSLGETLSALSNSESHVQPQIDVALSNELKLVKFPNVLNFFSLPGKPEDWRKLFATCPYVWFQWSGMLASFADKNTLQHFLPGHIRLSNQPSLDLNATLNHQPRNHPGFEVRDVINQVNYLISQAWNQYMADLGLLQYEMANGFLAWYFPLSDSESGMLPFTDVYGEQRKRQVMGFSGKNKLHWHFAIEIKPHYGHKPKLQLTPHVIFTEDGIKPLADKAKMHRMRRSFCRSWWNPRWRDLLLAYLNLLSDGQPTIEVKLSETASFSLDSRPMMVETDYVLTSTEINTDVEDVLVDLKSEEDGDDN